VRLCKKKKKERESTENTERLKLRERLLTTMAAEAGVSWECADENCLR
jgi:hypothetical protein